MNPTGVFAMGLMRDRKRSKRRITWAVVSGGVAFLLTATAGLPQEKTGLESHPMPGSFARIVKQAGPSVVNISAARVVKVQEALPSPFGPDAPFGDFFDWFFRYEVPRDFRSRSLGTGFVIDKEGYILTTNHVVAGVEGIKVLMSDKREFSARIVGRDPMTDLAIIKIETENPLVPLKLGDSKTLDVGDWGVAIGNPFGLGNTVTAGIVSAKYRRIGAGPYDNLIQTDAPINPGNSGGPLLNLQGEVIGINSAIFSQNGANIGISFAIPINRVKDLLPQLMRGRVIRGWMGVMVQTITPALKEKLDLEDEKGALIAALTVGGPADKAGIRRGDVIVAYDGKRIDEASNLPYLAASTPVGKSVHVEVIRKRAVKHFQVKIVELPEQAEPSPLSKEAPSLGIVVEEITAELAEELGLRDVSGIIVIHVEDDGAGAAAGVDPGDIILEVDQVPVKSLAQFQRLLDRYNTDDTILFFLKRHGTTLYLTLELQ
jgi:serine protease Do